MKKIAIFYLFYIDIKNELKFFINIFSLKRLLISKKIKRENKKLKEKKFDFFTKFSISDKSEEKILITTFLGIYDYLKYEYLIAIYLSNIEKKTLTVLVEENDKITKNFFLRKGINNFIYYKSRSNFFIRIKYLIKSYKLISHIKNVENFVNFKYEGLPTGKIIYSHICRFARIPTLKTIDHKFYNILANYLHYANEFKEIIYKNKFKHFIQSETQFIPPAIFSGYALKKKCNMISRMGNNKIVSIRQTSSFNHVNECRWKFDVQTFNVIKKNYKKKAIKAGKKIIYDRFRGISNLNDKAIDSEASKFAKVSKVKFIENYDKNSICKKFNWDASKPIGIIFGNDLTDGLFTMGKGIYRDNYIWLEKVIKFASLNQNMNWLVKSHPSDLENSGKIKVKNLFFNNKYPENIKFFPENFGRNNLFKIVDIVYTNYGTAGYEYPALGIPSVTSSEHHYQGMKIAYETKTEKELYTIIINSHKIKKLNKSYVENAQIFTYLENVFCKIRLDLATNDFSDESLYSVNYWKRFEKNFKNSKIHKLNSIKNDEFYINFKYQIDKKLKHSINCKLL